MARVGWKTTWKTHSATTMLPYTHSFTDYRHTAYVAQFIPVLAIFKERCVCESYHHFYGCWSCNSVYITYWCSTLSLFTYTYSILYWPLSKGSIMYIILCKIFMGAEATIAFVFAFNCMCLFKFWSPQSQISSLCECSSAVLSDRPACVQ